MDPKGKIPLDCKLMTDGLAPTLLIHARTIDNVNDQDHVERVILTDDDTNIPISRILSLLGDRGIQSLMVEGGLETWSRFLNSGLVDRVHLCQSPVELSGEGQTFGNLHLEKAGFTCISEIKVGIDTISHWE